jgi:Bacterial Ig-like domain (group 2)/WD40-like Beta Propeller Repeat
MGSAEGRGSRQIPSSRGTRLVALLAAIAVVAVVGGVVLIPRLAAVRAGPLARIQVAPEAALLTAPGETRQLQAQGLDAAGNAVTVTVTWSSTHPDKVAVDANGLVTAKDFGSAQIVATSGDLQSLPMFAVVATPASGVILVSDDQVVSDPVATTPDAAPSDDDTYRTTLKGLSTKVGDVLFGTGEKPVVGRVVTAETKGPEVTVTLSLVPLEDLFPHLRIEETFDLSRVDVQYPPEVSRLYDISRTGNTFSFRPKAEFDSLIKFSPAASAVGLRVPTGRTASLGLFAPEPSPGEFEIHLPPFDECKATVPTVPVELGVRPDITFELSPTYDVLWTAEDKHAIVHAQPRVTIKAGLKVTAAMEAKLECTKEWFTFPIPLPGPFEAFLGGALEVGGGVELGGKLTAASLNIGVEAQARDSVAFGLQCAAATLGCGVVHELGPVEVAWAPKLETPSLANLRLEPSFEAFGSLKLKMGSLQLAQWRFELMNVKIGAKLAGDYAPQTVQILDPEYRSSYKLSIETSAKPGDDLQSLAAKLRVGVISALAKVVSGEIAKSPSGTLKADRPSYNTGDTGHANVTMEAENLKFLGFYNIDRILLVRYAAGAATVLASQTATPGQSEFDLTFPVVGVVDATELYAFVVTKLAPLDLLGLELARRSSAPRIAYVDNSDLHIYVMNPNGSGRRRVTSGTGSDHVPTWSPDGSQIAFERNDANGAGIFIMSVDDLHPQAPVQIAADGANPAWSPDGRYIAFSQDGDIWLIKPDGSDLHRLGAGSDPAWSPDGSSLAVVRASQAGRISGADLYVMTADGSGARQLTSGKADGMPAWSPDGTRILFNRIDPSVCYCNAQIYVVGSASGSAVKVGNLNGETKSPTWSPDGTQIAFGMDTTPVPCGIYTMNADGSGVQLVNSKLCVDWPVWSP